MIYTQMPSVVFKLYDPLIETSFILNYNKTSKCQFLYSFYSKTKEKLVKYSFYVFQLRFIGWYSILTYVSFNILFYKKNIKTNNLCYFYMLIEELSLKLYRES
jgi:hypothetical protein